MLVDDERSNRLLMNATFARMFAEREAAIQYKQHCAEFGLALLNAGFNVIPCPHLDSCQIIVSQDVYDAIKRNSKVNQVTLLPHPPELES